ncbi:unnamed protein product [Cyprideis torosa]|uniref:Uncharacterized protein n=1 Tax=Cyprideis torosa TaxID=163714 RepID=A0A7R8WSI6_9CRUS|nr:unnamed protein product [Cyprideis torosa]CAG0907686.1 unnamed protein product [Cyprideis torosa]
MTKATTTYPQISSTLGSRLLQTMTVGRESLDTSMKRTRAL